jgi:hypothetical protein
MLAEHLHDLAAARQEFVVERWRPATGDWSPRIPLPDRWTGFRPGRRSGNCAARIQLHHIAQETAQHMRVADARDSGLGDFDARSRRKSGMRKSRNSNPPLALGFAPMRRSPSAPAPPAPASIGPARRRVPRDDSCAASFPAAQMLGVLGRIGQRHLMRSEGSFVRLCRRRPSVRSSPWARPTRSSANADASVAVTARVA